VSNLSAYGPLAYTDNECAKQLLYALDLMVLLLILIMNVLNNGCMLLIIMYGI
jgi:hypothetical protein